MQNFAIYPSLKDKTVFVTGGASGIGADILRGFAEQGARVGFIDFDAHRSAARVAELEEMGATIAFEQADLRDILALGQAFANLLDRLGPPHALINNAARDDRHNWQDVTPEYYDERIAGNLRHMFFAIQAVAPAMIAAGNGGAIVNMGSNSWWQATGGMPVYTTAKAGVHGMTRSFARDLGGDRIRVNTVVPGWIMTERQKDLWVTEESLTQQLERQCLHEAIAPHYVARMVLWLCSDDAAMCSASNFFVEGGAI
jgi:NAD(P)-dependent dehydrogenase (short-subunit alcohol dehydrogenase family)